MHALTMLGVVASAVLLMDVAFACSPEGEMYAPKTIQEKVYFSHAVVVGRAVHLYPTPSVGPQAYTVTLQVECVFKDIQNTVVVPNFNVTEAGVIEGLCHSAIFRMGTKSIAFLKADASGLLKPWESPIVASQYNLDEVMKTCNIQATGSQCPSASSVPCIPDSKNFAETQTRPAGDDGHDHHTGEHHDEHEHHGDEDSGLQHSHEEHHKGDENWAHDHDHTDHHDEHGEMHHSDHVHHDDEDKEIGHSHDDHHDDRNFEHDHDHSDHHHKQDGHDFHDDHEHDHDHEHENEAGSVVGGCSHTRISAVAILLILLTTLIVSN